MIRPGPEILPYLPAGPIAGSYRNGQYREEVRERTADINQYMQYTQ
jgi:hypothetical protein